MVSGIDFTSGRITYLETSDYLKEDLLQVSYPENYIIDVGWYPDSEDENGLFIIFVIEEYDWEKPILKLSTPLLKNIEPLISEAVVFMNEVLEKRR